MSISETHCQRLLCCSGHAVSRQRNELLAITENSVLVLDSALARDCRAIRQHLPKPALFFVRVAGNRKVNMSRHEALVGSQIISVVLTASEVSAIKRWSARMLGDETLCPEMAHIAISYALLHPADFARWMESQAEYCQAEQLTATEHSRSQVAATYDNLEELP